MQLKLHIFSGAGFKFAGLQNQKNSTRPVFVYQGKQLMKALKMLEAMEAIITKTYN